MAYTPNNLRLLQAAIASGGASTWTYVSADASTVVDTSGYISDAKARGLKVGDIVQVTNTATPIVTNHYVISINATTGAADLSNGTTMVDGSSNSD